MWTAILVLLTIGCLLFIAAGALTLHSAAALSRFLDREFKRADEQIEKNRRKLFEFFPDHASRGATTRTTMN